jgi:thiol-disulfide isomerase/thioredoxin
MRSSYGFVLAALGLPAFLGLAGPAGAEETPAHPALAIGSKAPDFDLPGVDGRRYSLRDFADARVLVVVFSTNHCPTAQAYESRVQGLHDDYVKKGVRVVVISPNDPQAVRLDEQGFTDLSDTLDEMKVRAKDRGFLFPYLYDGETQETSRRYGPAATPHAFVFDQDRVLRFSGRIDNAEDPAKVKTRETRDAIEALLAGRPVPVATTKTFGCSIKWADKRALVADGFREWANEEVKLAPVDEAGLRDVAKNSSGKLRLVNVWATWCGPCVTEFGDLVAVNRMYRGRDFEVVTVSADVPEKTDAVLRFLKEKQASTRNLQFDKGDPYAMVEALDAAWQGEIPHTLLVAPGGKVIWRSEGAFDRLALRKAIVGHLGRYYHSVAGKAELVTLR